MTAAQASRLRGLCERYGVPFREGDYSPQFDLPAGYVAGWVGGADGAPLFGFPARRTTIYVGVDELGESSS